MATSEGDKLPLEIEANARDEEVKAKVSTAGEEGLQEAPTADSSIHLSAATEFNSYLARAKQQCWAVASFKGPFYEPTSRAPVDIVAVIDKSGSMRGSKLDLVKKTLLFVIEQCKISSAS